MPAQLRLERVDHLPVLRVDRADAAEELVVVRHLEQPLARYAPAARHVLQKRHHVVHALRAAERDDDDRVGRVLGQPGGRAVGRLLALVDRRRHNWHGACMQQWTDPAWLTEATAWIDERAERTGEIAQPHVRPWATALRVPTADGDLWFKATIPAVAHEVTVLDRLAVRSAGSVPELVAADEARGWMLMRDGGERLREVIERERTLEHWLDVLPLYAELQIAATPDSEL